MTHDEILQYRDPYGMSVQDHLGRVQAQFRLDRDPFRWVRVVLAEAKCPTTGTWLWDVRSRIYAGQCRLLQDEVWLARHIYWVLSEVIGSAWGEKRLYVHCAVMAGFRALNDYISSITAGGTSKAMGQEVRDGDAAAAAGVGPSAAPVAATAEPGERRRSRQPARGGVVGVREVSGADNAAAALAATLPAAAGETSAGSPAPAATSD